MNDCGFMFSGILYASIQLILILKIRLIKFAKLDLSRQTILAAFMLMILSRLYKISNGFYIPITIVYLSTIKF